MAGRLRPLPLAAALVLTAWLLSIPSGDSARIYRTSDGGEHWTLQFQNHDPAAFYDCFAFWDRKRAIAISDAVGGRLPILLTHDGGNHWTLRPVTAQPAADSGEGSPAASGTCVVAKRPGFAWIGTIGGKQGARVLRTSNGGRSWQSSVSPIGHHAPGAGIFTLVLLQSCGRPVTQYSHVPQNTDVQVITRSPAFT